MKKIVQGVAGQLGKLALDTTIEAVKEPLGLEKLTGSSSNPQGQSQAPGKPGAKKTDFTQMMKKDQVKSGAEIANLRVQLSKGEGGAVGPVRNVEKEIREVRMKKEKMLEEKERELLAQVEQKRKEEEALAEQDAMPVSSRPKRGSALARGKSKQGTRETDMRRSV